MGQLHNQRARADKQLQVISVPNRIITASTSIEECGKKKLLRIEGTAGGFVRFTDDETDTTAPSASTKETIKTEEGFFYVVSTGKYILASASMRVEITED